MNTASTCSNGVLKNNFLLNFLSEKLNKKSIGLAKKFIQLFSHEIALVVLVAVVQSLSCVRLCDPMDSRPLCPSPSPGVCPSSCPLNWWWHPTVSFSVTPLSSCPQSFPVLESFPMNQLFASSGQSIGASASGLVLLNEYSGFISFKIDRFDLLALQGTVKSLLQHHSLKASILWQLVGLLYCPALSLTSFEVIPLYCTVIAIILVCI